MTTKQPDYSWAEQMVVIFARDIKDNDIAMMGGARHDIPFAAVMLAKNLYCPNLTTITTGCYINPKLTAMHYSGHTSVLYSKEADGMITGYDIFEVSERGYISFFFYHGLQMDKYGNVNLHFIGDWKKPTVRGPGAVNISMSVTPSRHYLFPIRHNKRTFVDKVDFITLPGFLDGGDSRKKAGIKGGGPCLCASPLGVFDFEEKSKRMRLKSVHEWVTVKDIVDNTGFELIIPNNVSTTQPPTKEELQMLREEIDPTGILRGMAGRL